ncbi:hypothetical protein GCM10010156_69850 [Planobispora rosea]|uniref:Protein kinase domain-containing protein n=1 Tax=Planobispora rosea TaxID=35762 RepID=A0A8J3S7Z5_PLARO|nr:protein kinase [Planobispora rosea]GGT01983.1 hypothetical protein GCM10010156_69850 [Planobispora rosea]GIH88410.1 hypothetical protein Pro02_68180 [Planobispora rosea]
MTADSPQRIGAYWLARRIGEGGQGVVYEAYDADGRRVALKVLHWAGDRGSRTRFSREAAASRRVASFCTAKVLDVELDVDRPYIVSEYVPGPNLRGAVTEGHRFGGDDLHRLATAIATALTAIHDAGVIHRDLKPDNVLLSPDGPRVIDFGIARTLEMSLTRTGEVSGTPGYMAPEIFTGQRATSAVDVFAWGAVMVFAATGADPFPGDNVGGVMHKVLSTQPDLSALPPRLASLVEAALRKDPADRPAARDLLLALVSANASDTSGLLAAGSRTARTVQVTAAADPELGLLAEDAYATLTPEERELAADLFLRLVTLDDDGQEIGRRAPFDELLDGRPERETATVRRILQAFSYLVAVDGGSVALSRPALLRAWPRLRSWVDADRQGLSILAQVTTAARHWADHGRRDGDLLPGSRLERALDWAATGRRHITLTPTEREFLQAGAGLAKRRSRRRQLTSVTLAGLLVLALGAGGLAFVQSKRADEQRDAAVARKVALEADTLRSTEPRTAMLLNVAAWRISADVDTRAGLTDALHQREIAALPEPGGTSTLSHDGRTLATVDPEGVSLFDVPTGKRTGGWRDPYFDRLLVHGAALNSEGRLLAVESDTGVTVWDVRTGEKRAELRSADFYGAPRIRFTDHATTLAVFGGAGGSGYFWDVAGDRTWGAYAPRTSLPFPLAVASTGELAARVEASGRLTVWRLPDRVVDPRLSRACPGSGRKAIAFSPDGRTLACAGSEIRLVDVATGEVRAPRGAGASWPWQRTGTGEVRPAASGGLRFSADGRLIAGFSDRTVRVWQVADQREILSYQTDTEIADARFDGDVLRVHADGVITLTVASPIRTHRIAGDTGRAVLSPDGRWMALKPDEGPVALWDVRAGRQAGALPAGRFPVGVMAFDPRGTMLVTGMEGDRLQAWDPVTREELWRAPLPADKGVGTPAFTADGRIVVVPTPDFGDAGSGFVPARPLVLDARTGRPLAESVLDPAGRVLLDGMDYVAISSRGLVATDAGDGRIGLLADGSRRTLLRGVRDRLDLLAFDTGGTLLASAGEHGSVQIWDLGTRRRVGDVITVSDGVDTLAFGAGGTVLYAGGAGRLHEIPVGGEQMAARVCARAGRTLTAQEWRKHLPGVAYREVCPSHAATGDS